jgi:hypothetical protein
MIKIIWNMCSKLEPALHKSSTLWHSLLGQHALQPTFCHWNAGRSCLTIPRTLMLPKVELWNQNSCRNRSITQMDMRHHKSNTTNNLGTVHRTWTVEKKKKKIYFSPCGWSSPKWSTPTAPTVFSLAQRMFQTLFKTWAPRPVFRLTLG